MRRSRVSSLCMSGLRIDGIAVLPELRIRHRAVHTGAFLVFISVIYV